MPVPAVMGGDVEQVRHPARVERFTPRDQRRIAAQSRINTGIIYRIITMVGVGGEHRIQVARVDAQPFQVSEMLRDALQVAAVKGDSLCEPAGTRRAPGRCVRAMAAMLIITWLRII